MLRLLSTSILVSISGGCKLYIAFQILKTEPNILLCIAFSLLVYAVYTLDRTLEKEFKRIPLIVICLSLLFCIAILIKEGNSPLSAIIPFLIGFLYTKGVKTFRLKQGYGIKNVVVAFTWAFTLVSFMFPYAENLKTIFLFFFIKSFINTIIYDYKDIREDIYAGVKTLPIILGEKKARMFLFSVHIPFHIYMLKFVDLFISAYSLIVGLIYIAVYARSRNIPLRDIFVDGEWINLTILLFFRNALQNI